MRIDNSQFKEDFTKRFDSFILSSPLSMLYDLSTLGVDLHIEHKEEGKPCFKTSGFLFDFSRSAKENIFDIKEYLIENEYPVLTKVQDTYTEVSGREKVDLLKSGDITAAEAVDYKIKKTIEESYVVVRVLPNQNIIHLKKDDTLFSCKFVMPLFYFRQHLSSNLEKANELFNSSVETLTEITTKRGA